MWYTKKRKNKKEDVSILTHPLLFVYPPAIQTKNYTLIQTQICHYTVTPLL